jgi:phage tail-like protein
MNVNGSKFHMLLGRTDWGACVSVAGALSGEWDDRDAQGAEIDTIDQSIPSWDSESRRLSLAQIPETLPPTQGEQQLVASDRRAAAADRSGNVYAISADRKAIEIASPAVAAPYPFWPDRRYRPAPPANPFADAVPQATASMLYTALAVTNEHFLVVAFIAEGLPGLLRFDLVGGGEPERFSLDPVFVNPVADLVSDGCSGLWLLDAVTRRIYRLDRNLQPYPAAPVAEETDLFQPDAPLPARQHVVAPDRLEILFPAARIPLQMAAGEGEELFVLTARAAGGSAVYVLDPGETDLRKIGDDSRDWAMFAYSATGAVATDKGQTLVFVPATGNQAFAFAITRNGGGTVDGLSERPWLLPMRRFGGHGLLVRSADLVYDSGTGAGNWIPLVRQRRRQFALSNAFQTASFDSGVPQCVWDRIRLDACIPPGTAVRIWARTADDEAAFATMIDEGWVEQPLPYLNRDGGELAGKQAKALPPTDAEHGTGSWDLLLQKMVGRFVQLRIMLTGDGRNSPMLRALRIWYPRFSYSERFLPALYREQTEPADFLDRFLANMEGVNSVIEDKIAAAQWLFDTRSASPEMLDWLSDWFDVVLEPSWNDARRRLFLRNATTFFGWRGTIAGMTLALRLAFDESLTDADFAFGGPQCTGPGTIRIVENFSTAKLTLRQSSASIAVSAGPAMLSLSQAWAPKDGSAGLFLRLGMSPTGRFPLFADASLPEEAQAVMQSAFGFLPRAGALERSAWQAFQQSETGSVAFPDLPVETVTADVEPLWSAYRASANKVRYQWQAYLEQRYRRITRLNQSYRSNWTSFAEIPLPDYLPDSSEAIEDWLQFEGQLLPRMGAAHRFSVLLPVRSVNQSGYELEADMALAKRIVEIEKPAHTVCDVRFYWAMNRVGEARIGSDTELGAGSRAPELIPPAILGQAYLGSGFVGGPQGRVEYRERLAC